MKINKILENRTFSVKTSPYNVFEKKIVDAFYLERKIMMMKFGKKEQYQSRIQLIVFLVSCLEYFLQEIFKLAIDKTIISVGELKKTKNFNSVKANIDELQEINKNKIKISEIMVEEMNFQNIKDIVLLCDLLKIGKNFKNLPTQETNIRLSKLRGKIPDPRKKHSPNIEKKMTKFIIENFGANFALPKEQEKLVRMVNTVNKMIFLRHKIVHKAQLVKIDNWESLVYTMATVQLAFIINECYKVELKKIKTKNAKTKN
ncbi:MAG: hypothetical protein KKD48_04140 [Nanoarchaeota archaeon]|nr:hypothetical protein [Nanoarchaeota archaeon]